MKSMETREQKEKLINIKLKKQRAEAKEADGNQSDEVASGGKGLFKLFLSLDGSRARFSS